MKLTDLFLAELEREVPATRKMLERVDDPRSDWKPHPKSMPYGYLARLVATLPSWIVFTVNQESLDLKPVNGPEYKSPEPENAAELVALFDKSVADAREALQATNDEHLMLPWKLLVAGNEVHQAPRHVVLRDSVMSHLAHHRGQLSVYLRMRDIAVPAIYGPSADEQRF